MELKMMFYLSNVAIVVNMSQPSVRIGGGLYALIHIYFVHGGSKSPKPLWDLHLECCLFFKANSFHLSLDLSRTAFSQRRWRFS